MRAVIRNMSELTDSREIMEARTHPAIMIFTSILLLLLTVGLTWSFIGEIDEVAKASGVVRPNEKVSNIQTTVLGTVESLHVTEGQWVEDGDLLMSLEHDSLKLELLAKKAELEILEQESKFLKRYRESVVQHSNLFSKEMEEESVYFHLVEQYLLEFSQWEFEFDTSIKQIEQAKNESVLAKEGIELSQRVAHQKQEEVKADYTRQIAEIEKELAAEQQLKQSLELEESKLSESEIIRTERFNQYMLALDELKMMIDERENKVSQSISLGERFVPKSQLEAEQALLESAKLQLIQFQQEALLTVQSQISDYENKLKELRLLLGQLENKESSIVLEQETYKLEEEKLNEQYQNLQKQSDSIYQKSSIELEKFKLDRIVQVESALEEKEKVIQSLHEGIKQLELAIEKQSVYAPITGMVHMIRDMNVGDIVQPGEPLLSIIPVNESMYKISIAVPNHEIGQIAEGQKVNMNFHAFPKQSFGSLVGTVNSISSDSMTNQDGRSYYVVEASIANQPLVNRKGESGEIRVGMTAEAYIITDSKKIIHYLLEKINLRE